MMKRRITAGLLCLFCVAAVFFLPVAASAAEAEAAVQTYTLNINFCPDGVPLEGAEFRVWRVAELADDESLRLTEAFAGYPISLEDQSSDALRALASTLLAYAARDGIPADATAVTNSSGVATMTGLLHGMYLVAGISVTVWGTEYTPSASIVSLPGEDGSNEVVMEPKLDQKIEDDDISLHVLKIWRNDTAQTRPQQIVVQLLCDGALYSEVALTAENNWRYTWTGLERGHVWLVLEKEVPKDYTVAVTQEATTFTVTNTYHTTPPTVPTPPKPADPMLPQTGQLWWPVFMLLVPGCILLVSGVALKSRDE